MQVPAALLTHPGEAEASAESGPTEISRDLSYTPIPRPATSRGTRNGFSL